MSKNTKIKIRNIRIEKLNAVDWYSLKVEVFQISPYQYRYARGRLVIDYYPTSGRYCDINKGKWGECPADDFVSLFRV